MSKNYFETYTFAELESHEGAIDDIQTLERKLSEAYGSPITLIAFVDENSKARQ